MFRVKIEIVVVIQEIIDYLFAKKGKSVPEINNKNKW